MALIMIRFLSCFSGIWVIRARAASRYIKFFGWSLGWSVVTSSCERGGFDSLALVDGRRLVSLCLDNREIDRGRGGKVHIL